MLRPFYNTAIHILALARAVFHIQSKQSLIQKDISFAKVHLQIDKLQESRLKLQGPKGRAV